jgi:hypothetical protein
MSRVRDVVDVDVDDDVLLDAILLYVEPFGESLGSETPDIIFIADPGEEAVLVGVHNVALAKNKSRIIIMHSAKNIQLKLTKLVAVRHVGTTTSNFGWLLLLLLDLLLVVDIFGEDSALVRGNAKPE